MSYTKTTWINGTTDVDADNMNKIENELEFLDLEVADLNSQVFDNLKTSVVLDQLTHISTATDSSAGISDLTIGGATLNQVVVNGDFVNGTTGWVGGSSVLTALNKILTVTGNGASLLPLAQYNLALNGSKRFYKTRVRVTNTSCTQIQIRNSAGTLAASVNNPVQNQWYNLIVVGTPSDEALQISHRYADAATANGKVMEVDGNVGVFAIPLTGTPYESYTADQMNALIGEYWEGLKSVERVEISSRGRNLFDGELLDNSSYSISSGTLVANTSRVAFKNPVKIEPNSEYKLDKISARRTFLDINKNFIRSTGDSNSTSILSQSNEHYVLCEFLKTVATEGINTKIMLNEGSTALPYEPYDGSKVTVNLLDETKFSLAKVSGGTQNTINFNDSKFRANKNNDYKLWTSAMITALTTGTNVQYITVPLSGFTGIKTQVALALDGSFAINKSWVETASAIDTAGNQYKYSTDATNLYVAFPLGTYADLASARTALTTTTPTECFYTLKTPIIIEEEDFADYGIEVVGALESNIGTLEVISDNFNIQPPVTFEYPTTTVAGTSSIKNTLSKTVEKVDRNKLEFNTAVNYANDVGGTANAITLTTTAFGGFKFSIGSAVRGIAIANNTGTMTATIDGGSTLPIKVVDAGAYVDVDADTFEEKKPFELVCQNDGVIGDFFLLAPRGSDFLKGLFNATQFNNLTTVATSASLRLNASGSGWLISLFNTGTLSENLAIEVDGVFIIGTSASQTVLAGGENFSRPMLIKFNSSLKIYSTNNRIGCVYVLGEKFSEVLTPIIFDPSSKTPQTTTILSVSGKGWFNTTGSIVNSDFETIIIDGNTITDGSLVRKALHFGVRFENTLVVKCNGTNKLINYSLD